MNYNIRYTTLSRKELYLNINQRKKIQMGDGNLANSERPSIKLEDYYNNDIWTQKYKYVGHFGVVLGLISISSLILAISALLEEDQEIFKIKINEYETILWSIVSIIILLRMFQAYDSYRAIPLLARRDIGDEILVRILRNQNRKNSKIIQYFITILGLLVFAIISVLYYSSETWIFYLLVFSNFTIIGFIPTSVRIRASPHRRYILQDHLRQLLFITIGEREVITTDITDPGYEGNHNQKLRTLFLLNQDLITLGKDYLLISLKSTENIVSSLYISLLTEVNSDIIEKIEKAIEIFNDPANTDGYVQGFSKLIEAYKISKLLNKNHYDDTLEIQLIEPIVSRLRLEKITPLIGIFGSIIGLLL